MDINEYIEKLLIDKLFLKSEYHRYMYNDYNIQNVDGIIDANSLHMIICNAKRNRRLRSLLVDILSYCDNNSMSDENFRLLLKFPIRYRNTYLSQLSHIDLSFYQMQIINRYPLSLEAFGWLFDHICHYDFFTEEDMRQILRDNSGIRSVGIDAYVDLTFQKYGASSKLDVATKWSNDLKKIGK